MIRTNFKFNHSIYADELLNASITQILNNNQLFSIATIRENESYIHTSYYCFNSSMDFYFLTDPNSQHIQNMYLNPSVALAIYDSHQSWDDNKCGLQVFGICEEASGKKLVEGTMLYLRRFTSLRQWIKHPNDFLTGAISSKLYLIRTKWLKLFDEGNFGEEVFITLRLKN